MINLPDFFFAIDVRTYRAYSTLFEKPGFLTNM